MPKIVQIEDCIYGKLKNVSTEQWLDMLETRYDIERGFGMLLDDYVLLEQTDSRYEDGRLIYSERINYNLHLSTTQPFCANAPKENTDAWEDSWVIYDRKNDRFVVHYIHYLPEVKKDLPQVACEADLECSGEDRQAAPEVEVQAPERKPIPQQPTITTTIQTDDGHRQWRKKTLQKLEYLYTNGYNAQEIAAELNCLLESVYYNLKKLGYEDLFSPSVWKPRQTQANYIKPVEERPHRQAKLKYMLPGTKYHHPTYGDSTVYKDNETVTVLILKDGTKKRIIKS